VPVSPIVNRAVNRGQGSTIRTSSFTDDLEAKCAWVGCTAPRCSEEYALGEAGE
jgi:hypothetical protein